MQALGLVVARVGYRLGQGEGGAIPPGLIAGAVVQMPAEGGPCGPAGATAVYVARGEAVWEFRLPSELGVEAGKLVVEVGSEGGWEAAPGTAAQGTAAPEMAVYDWEAGDWVPVAEAVLGRNVVEGVGGLVSAEGRVRVRLRPDGGRGGCYDVGLGVEGGR